MQVLDLTRNLAGPFCTMILGDLGADVIKVERPGVGDDTRSWAPPTWNGVSTTFLSANRSKRSLGVNLDTAEGVEIVRRLATSADVLVETFRPGSLDKRALGYKDLKELNPGLIYCSISAYGQVGPLRDAPGYDAVVQAKTGIMSLTGYADEPPARLGIGAVDLGTALWTTVGILSAWATRNLTGRGCRIEASLFEVAAWWLSYHVTGYLATQVVPQRSGTAVGFIEPYELFPTADEDLFIAAPNNSLFVALLGALEMVNLVSDLRFADNPARVQNRLELHKLISQQLMSRPAIEWERRLNAVSVPCSRVRTVADLVTDEQLAALRMLRDVPHPTIQNLRLVDIPISRDGSRAEHHLPPPELGEHTGEILRKLGYSDDRIRLLRQSHVVS